MSLPTAGEAPADWHLETTMKKRKAKQNRVVMIRHAQSEWNRQDRFSGWADPQLTEAGRMEAVAAGRRLAEAGYRFEQAYSSRLIRVQTIADLVLHHASGEHVRTHYDWRLNERHYGALQGLNKTGMAGEVGEEQVWRWRRGYHDRPPAMAADDPEHPAVQRKWDDIPAGRIPNAESLAQTRRRVVEFWDEMVAPQVRAGRSILVSSHGNTLRALLMALDDMSIAEVESFEIPTGLPIIYRFDAQGRALGWEYLHASRDAA
jgi:2,3-bisphosphoglycerate-dependent phosphoglycerate mutase